MQCLRACAGGGGGLRVLSGEALFPRVSSVTSVMRHPRSKVWRCGVGVHGGAAVPAAALACLTLASPSVKWDDKGALLAGCHEDDELSQSLAAVHSDMLDVRPAPAATSPATPAAVSAKREGMCLLGG